MSAIILPIYFYQDAFGWGVWKSHKQWAEMGSALGGIYSPILALLTLVVLMLQYAQSVKNDAYSQAMYQTSSYKEQGTDKLNLLAVDINMKLSDVINDTMIRGALGKNWNNEDAFLNAQFRLNQRESRDMTLKELLLSLTVNKNGSEQDYEFFSSLLEQASKQIIGKWMSFNTALSALKAGASVKGDLQYIWANSSLNLMTHASDMLGYETCMALDEWVMHCHKKLGKVYSEVNFYKYHHKQS
ncbi:hypothetical protein L4D06_08650 [Enterovibrio makurazakiensis]|uniref:hypothetical protein n=1 Tax=Enterovibrio makurazakiensis TaxID=2910232 RepID=UPI003D1D89C3